MNAKKPSYFIGSMLRGGLGYTLKRVVCINHSFICKGCFACSNCLYYEFYELKNTYHKYRIDFDVDDELFRFGVYLFDDKAEKLPYLLSAIVNLLKEKGLTRNNITYNKFYIYIDDKEIYDSKEFKLLKNYIKTFQIDSFYANVAIRLQTPLRIKKDNRFVRAEDLKIEDILNSVYQRYLLITGKERKKLPFKPSYEIEKRDVYLKKLTRYSNRQKTKMQMDGVMGEVTVKNLDKESYRLLKLAQIIGIGKQTVMGLGKIKVEDI